MNEKYHNQHSIEEHIQVNGYFMRPPGPTATDEYIKQH